MTGAPPSGHNPHSFEVRLYPRSANFLLDLLDTDKVEYDLHTEPQYVRIDIDNLANQLRAHLQRVAIGV